MSWARDLIGVMEVGGWVHGVTAVVYIWVNYNLKMAIVKS